MAKCILSLIFKSKILKIRLAQTANCRYSDVAGPANGMPSLVLTFS